MSDTLTVTIPGEPIAWERPVRLKGGRTITPGRVVQAEHAIGTLVKVAAQEQGFDLPLEGPVGMALYFALGAGWNAPRGIKDWDNLAKLVSDALNMVAYHDDRQLVRVEVTVYRGSALPGTVIVLRELERQEAT
jgi:Holliday junction resolvase RusA-like endonuclease